MNEIGHREFLTLLIAHFPEIADEVAKLGSVLLHLEVATFRQATERAMDAGQFWAAEQHFRFVERLLGHSHPDVVNALEVSYIEDLALGECTPVRRRAVLERMPTNLRVMMATIHPNWK